MRHGSTHKLLALSLLFLALVLVATPAILALVALLRGDVDRALAVLGPVLLIPLGFVLVGIYFSLKHAAGARGNRSDDA